MTPTRHRFWFSTTNISLSISRSIALIGQALGAEGSTADRVRLSDLQLDVRHYAYETGVKHTLRGVVWGLLKKQLSVLFRPLHFLLYAIGGLVPRDDRQWAFGAWGGSRFGDNPGALFLHCHRVASDGEGVRVAWITSDPAIRRSLNQQGLPAYSTWSPAGVWWTLRSGVHIYSAIPKDINYWLSRGAHHVLLRHGIGIKKIARAIDVPSHRLYKLYRGSFWQRLLYSIAIPWNHTVPDLVFSTSEEHGDQAPGYFGVQRSKVRVTGSPRLDRLIEPDEPMLSGGTPFDFAQMRNNFSKIFLFMPTCIESSDTIPFSWEDLDQSAREAGVGIAVKVHPDDAPTGKHHLESQTFENLRFVDPKLDPVTLYPDVDGLITDFSSAAFDFLLLDRPIVYYVPNLKTFLSARSLIDDLSNVTAGPICENVKELADELGDSDANVERYRAKRHELKTRFHQFEPGGASARTRREILVAIDDGWS